MTDPLFFVAGQVVLVSGGSRGIGRAIAEGFAQRGSKVVITGREQATLDQTAKEIGANVHAIVCDVARPASIRECARRALKQFGRVDTLVNCAGVNRRKPAIEFSEEDYDFVTDINLKGAFLMSQEIGRSQLERGAGCQINIASLNTDRPLKNVLPYAMSKAGMGHMTRGLALEWGPRGVRVNAIAPGFILTDLTEKLWSNPTMQQWNKANTPQQRLGTPQDMVGAAIFLASPASAFMTGQTLYVDGGYTAGWMWPIPEA
jgi:NAD(P)-dependent dehydrogenase (short-subunit alcohol dehydrogenase family)